MVEELIPQQKALHDAPPAAAAAVVPEVPGTVLPAAGLPTVPTGAATTTVPPAHPTSNPKWVDRPRTSLHARAYLRLGMWQWAMDDVSDKSDVVRWM